MPAAPTKSPAISRKLCVGFMAGILPGKFDCHVLSLNLLRAFWTSVQIPLRSLGSQ